MVPVLNYVQLIANLSALVVIGWIYAAYVKNLRSTIDLKNGELESLRTNLQLWKDGADELERKSPDRLAAVLSDRIKIREEELERLVTDRQQHQQEIKERNSELEKLRYELQKAKDVGKSIVIWDHESHDERIITSSELELVKMGEVFVDSASLMICDPGYIKEVWHEEEYTRPAARLIDKKDNRVYKHWKDFQRYDEPLLADSNSTVTELIKEGRLERIPDPKENGPYPMSLSGAMYASCNDNRYGSLVFQTGEEGAGICFSTVYGDGTYPVYGEKFRDKIVRVYVELQ